VTCVFSTREGADVVTKNSAWKPARVVSRFVRRVRSASGAVAVQIVTRRGRAVEQVEHLGSARTDADLTLLLAAAQDRLSPGQDALELGELSVVPARLDDVADWTSKPHPSAGQTVLDDEPAPAPRRGRPAAVDAGGRVVATSSLVLWRVLTAAYARVGFDALGDEAFRAMVLARIVEPTSKAHTLRMLAELGAPCPSLRTLFRSLKRCQDSDYRDKVAKACTARSAAAGGNDHRPAGGGGWPSSSPRRWPPWAAGRVTPSLLPEPSPMKRPAPPAARSRRS